MQEFQLISTAHAPVYLFARFAKANCRIKWRVHCTMDSALSLPVTHASPCPNSVQQLRAYGCMFGNNHLVDQPMFLQFSRLGFKAPWPQAEGPGVPALPIAPVLQLEGATHLPLKKMADIFPDQNHWLKRLAPSRARDLAFVTTLGGNLLVSNFALSRIPSDYAS